MKKSAKRRSTNLRTVSVYQTTPGGRKLRKYFSIKEAALATNTDPSNISKATRGLLQTAGGYHWKTV